MQPEAEAGVCRWVARECDELASEIEGRGDQEDEGDDPRTLRHGGREAREEAARAMGDVRPDLAAAYPHLPSRTIDYAVMEPAGAAGEVVMAGLDVGCARIRFASKVTPSRRACVPKIRRATSCRKAAH